jgi:hypothetical protein
MSIKKELELMSNVRYSDYYGITVQNVE